MVDLGTLGGKNSWAGAVEGTVVVGSSTSAAEDSHAFAHDLAAAEPAMLDLGALDLTSRSGSVATDVDGNVVVGFANPSGDSRRPTAWVLRATTRPMFAFRHFDRWVKEGVGRATIRVTRSGRTDRAVTVRYRTHSDTATAGQDFRATSGKLRFPRGVTRRSFKVKILNDRRPEGREFLLLSLYRPSSPALLGSPGWSEMRIRASDR